MYTISNGPSKIVAKTRRGLHQHYQKFEKINESNNKRACNNNSVKNTKSVNNNPRPTFQPIRRINHHCTKVEESVITPQHEELINYVSDTWNMLLANNPYDACSEVVVSSNGLNGITNNSNIITTTIADSNNNNIQNGAYKSSMCTKMSVTTNGNKSSSTFVSTNVNEEIDKISSGSSSSSSDIMDSTIWPLTTPLPMSAPFVHNEPLSSTLTGFKPFDLEAMWGLQLFNNITQGT